MKAIGYIRVSTDDQAEHGLSLDAQREKIAAWAALNEHELLETIPDEGISGKAMKNRPGLERAIELAEEHKAVLVVISLSRLSRSLTDTIAITKRLQRAGADLASCREKIDTTTAVGKLFFHFMAMINEFERDTIAERTKAVLDHKRQNGEALGNTPFGFTASRCPACIAWLETEPAHRGPRECRGGDCGLLVANSDEQRGLEIIVRHASNGTCRFAEIARELDEAGVPTRSGSPWDRGVVRRLIRFYRSDEGKRLTQGQ